MAYKGEKFFNYFVLLRRLKIIFFRLKILANSANTKCHSFLLKIDCSIFIIDRLQQWYHMTFLVSLFVTSRNLLFGVFLPRKIITISQKITVNFRQVLLTDVLLSESILELFFKIFSKYLWKSWILCKTFTTDEHFHKWFLKFQ